MGSRGQKSGNNKAPNARGGSGAMMPEAPTTETTQYNDPLAEATKRNNIIWLVASSGMPVEEWIDFVKEQSGEPTSVEELNRARKVYNSLSDEQKQVIRRETGNGANYGIGVLKQGADIVITIFQRDTSRRKATPMTTGTRRIIAPNGTITMAEMVRKQFEKVGKVGQNGYLASQQKKQRFKNNLVINRPR